MDKMPPTAPLETSARFSAPCEIEGHVFDPLAPEKRFVVELWLDGLPARIARAHLFDPDLAADPRGDGGYRFVFALDAETLQGAEIAEVRLANSAEAVGAPLRLAEAPGEPAGRPIGQARWIGGLRIRGWIAWSAEGAGEVRARLDGETVAETRALDFSHVGEAACGGIARGFDLHLPAEFADGRLRRIHVFDAQERELPGSPCPVIAFPRGLAQFLEDRAELGAERLRAGLFDRLLPQSLPVSQFAAWAQAFPPAPPFAAPAARLAVALIGEEGLEAALEALESQAAGLAAVGALSAGAAPLSFEPADLLSFLDAEAIDAEIVVFAPAGTVFAPPALGRLAEALASFPESPLAYGDLILADAHGREWPLAFPSFDYERMLEQGYCALAFAARIGHVRAALARGARDLFRLFNSAFDEGGPAAPAAAHAPGFLARLAPADLTAAAATLEAATRAHLEARRLNFTVEPKASDLLPAARVRRISPAGKVSILIPTRNRVDLLRPCLEALRRTLDGVGHEIFVIDNETRDAATLDYFQEMTGQGVRIAPVSGPFNFARAVNAGASVASGEFLLLLNNDVEALRPGWLEEMLSRLAEPDVGAVGAKLLFPGGGVQHGGVVLGPNLAATHAFDERADEDPGYGELMRVAHETSAVTAACLLTPRSLFRALGGFDGTRFPVLFNDVDYCLRLRAAGRRVVMAPQAKLMHRAGASRGPERPFDGRHRHQRDLDNLRMAWAEVLADDPFYSPMLGLDVPYAGLAWPPRSQAPRLPKGEDRKTAPAGF